jgi:hypothetical protein
MQHTTYLLVIAVITCMMLVCFRNQTLETFNMFSKSTIFVSVASYRDELCSDTLQSIFDMADDESRVFVGVCQQNKQGEDKEVCVTDQLSPGRRQRVRVIEVDFSAAKGPTYARYLCARLFRGETWFCQIDSHTTFVKGWDTKAIQNIHACPSDRPILTHYPHDVKNMHDQSVPVLCKSRFDPHVGVPTFEAVVQSVSSKPRRVPFMSGGFVFTSGKFLSDVPLDPTLYHLFQGEEILLSARAYTTGYDCFTPTQNLVGHVYMREQAPKFWTDIPDFHVLQRKTQSKVRRLLAIEKPPLPPSYPWGMGTRRSLKSYWKFAGIHTASKTSSSGEKFCGINK